MTGFGVRTRMAVGLMLVASLTVLGTALVVTVWLQGESGRRLELEGKELLSLLQSFREIRDRRVEVALSAIASDLESGEGDFLARAAISSTRSSLEVIDEAGRLMALAGLDLLEIVDREGVVVSSGHWPEQAGLVSRGNENRPVGGPFLSSLPSAHGEVLASMLCRMVGEGDRALKLVGGIRLGGGLPGWLDPGSVVLFRDKGGKLLLVSGEEMPENLSGSLPVQLSSDRQEVLERDGTILVLASIVLSGPSGDPAGELIVATDRTSPDSSSSRLTVLLVGVGVVSAILALLVGLYLSRSVTTPLEELVGAVESISSGEADYSFPASRRDEFQELMVSFSRMRRALELQRERLRAAERVAAWREAARRVAHEVKNPLAPIRLTMENLIKAREKSPEMFEKLFEDGARTVLEEVEQLRRIVTEFGEYARLPAPSPESVDLDGVVDSVMALYSGRDGLELIREGGGELPALELDPDQISRAVKNIVANGVEAIGPAGGRLLVRTGIEDGMALVAVEDTGPGFSGDASRRMFDPYFTTKSGGTGLGLAITHRIITEHGGLLGAENRSGGGARVVIKLPLSERDCQ